MRMPPRQRKAGGGTTEGKRAKEVLAVEQTGNGGGAKEAKAGGSDKEAQPVAAADKQDSSGKQYCKIHRTKGHDLQNCKKVEQLVGQQKAEYERRDKEKAQEGTRGSGKKRPGRGGRRGKTKQRQGDCHGGGSRRQAGQHQQAVLQDSPHKGP